MSLRLGLVRTIVISSSHFAEQFLKTHDSSFANRPSIEAITHVSYGDKGVVFSPYSPYWRSLRKWCTSELLSHSKVESFEPMRKEALCGVVQSLRSIAEARSIADLTTMVGSLSASITCKMVLGDEYVDAIHRVFDQLFEKIIDERVQEDGRGQKDFVDAMVSLMKPEEAEVRVDRANIKAVMLVRNLLFFWVGNPDL
ncbi:cytochrome P450 CYP736A12-like protein [Cinnamomum micranthum f. kanehirae]|uniref:Cytochrome P450 CYP736A12-like protein n=1 Tax=Cinnamomum micranthum f. kanehirae TaxID=337451 RepID=A0A443NZM3_9MAGN|nr:cytochrome P450 CYP736A12-like protein [Cinnamomum micranthum f. kanehirae]